MLAEFDHHELQALLHHRPERLEQVFQLQAGAVLDRLLQPAAELLVEVQVGPGDTLLAVDGLALLLQLRQQRLRATGPMHLGIGPAVEVGRQQLADLLRLVDHRGAVGDQRVEALEVALAAQAPAQIAQGDQQQLQGGEALLAIDDLAQLHPAGVVVLLLEHHRTEEVRAQSLAGQRQAEQPLEVIPERLPVALAPPHIGALEQRDLVAHGGLENAHQRTTIGFHNLVPAERSENRLAQIIHSIQRDASPMRSSGTAIWAMNGGVRAGLDFRRVTVAAAHAALSFRRSAMPE
ncbi:hypothetical protein D3C78_1008730 [compost metagenome]